jgi:hypothetical protein
MSKQNLGQFLVIVGVAVIVLGVVVAAAQATLGEIKARSAQPTAAEGWDLPEGVVEIIGKMLSQGGGIAIAAVGIVLVAIGLEIMNDETANAGKAALHALRVL